MNRLTYARFRGITQHSFGPVVSIDALVAVDALGEVLALLTDAAPLIVEVDVKGEVVGVDLLVVLALVGVAMTVAGLALERVHIGVLEKVVC